MRRLVAGLVVTLLVVYAVGALFFYEQERLARENGVQKDRAPETLHHPEAAIAALRTRLESHDYTEEELFLLRRALVQAPSFYQTPFLLAIYHANRLERADRVRSGFEAAIRRYPANGRLHLAYGSWLLETRTTLAGWQDPGDSGRLRDPLISAEKHFRTSMELEPELAWRVLDVLAWYRIPPERWVALVPAHPLARRHLLDALFEGGHDEAALALARQDLSGTEEPAALRRIAQRGLDAGDPALALQASLKWRALVERTTGTGSELFEPVIFISRAENALGKPNKAYETLMETLERVQVEFGPSSRVSLEFLCTVGYEYLNRGRTLTAQSLFGQAVSRNPSYLPALLGLARSYARTNDDEEAIRQYQKILRLDGDHDEARRELRQMLVRAR